MVVLHTNSRGALRSTRASAFAILSVTAIFAFGCGSRPTASDLSHDVDQPTRSTHNWNWSEVSDANYHDVITPLVGLDNTQFLDQDHELTVWTQKWVDIIDAKIRSEHPAKLANTPKPNAKVIKEKSANAFVAPVPVCYNVKVKLKSGTPNASNTADSVYLNAKDGEFSAWPDQLTCVAASNDREDIKSYIAAYNASSVGCKFELSAAGVLQGNAKCALNADLAGAVAADKIVLFQTANYITVHTAIFGLMSEEALISVIAHELGHYYRSHVVGVMQEFDFFYTLGDGNAASRPVPEADKKALGDAAVAGATMLNATDSYTAIEGQKIRPELFMAIGSTIATACKTDECPDTCKATLTVMKSADFVSDMGTYPFASETPELKASYLSYEAKALACINDIKMATATTTMKPESIGYSKFLSFIETPVWPAWLGRISASGKRYVAQQGKLAAIRAGANAPAGATLKLVTAAIASEMNAQDDDSEKALKTAHTKRIGQYTAEQEADEVAAEWVNDIGIAPTHVVDAMRRLGKGSVTSLRGFILSEQDCEALWKRNWLDDQGNYAFVPVGDYSEVHHSSCYRMFNLDREIAAHTYRTPAPATPLLGAEGWRKVQEKAASLSAGLTERVPGVRPEVATLLKQTTLGSCTYSSSFH
jgi:hypothetical protein